MPVADPMVATLAELLLHVPPAGLLLNALAPSTQTVIKPVIDVGVGLTVTVTVALFVQPFAPVPTTVYVVVVVGDAVGEEHDVHDKPVDGDHE